MDLVPILCFVLVAGGFGTVGYWFVRNSLQIVPEGCVAVVERSGEFAGALAPGRHLLRPLDRIRAYVELSDFTESAHADSVFTQNATVVSLDMDIGFRIARYKPQNVRPDQQGKTPPVSVIAAGKNIVRQRDIYNAVYNVDDWKKRIQKEALGIMQEYFQRVNLARDIFGTDGGKLATIQSGIKEIVNQEAAKYGVEVTLIKLHNLSVDEATRNFLSAQKRMEQQNALLMQKAESQRIIRDTLGMDNDQLLRWFEIESLRQAATTDATQRPEDAGSIPTTGTFAVPRTGGNTGKTSTSKSA